MYHETKQSRTTNYYDEYGMAYNIDGRHSDDNPNRNQNQNGRRGPGSRNEGSNRNAGRGRGGRGWGTQGRGCSQGGPRARYSNDQESHNVVDSNIFEDDDSNNYSDGVIDYCYSLSRAQPQICDMFATLIIDSASSVDIIANRELAYNIHKARVPLKVKTINGRSTIRQQAYIGDYPPPVWLHPDGGVNIMSINNMQKYYRCTMDTDVQNCIDVHLQNGSILRFTASGNGLYQYLLKPEKTIDGIWTLFLPNMDPPSPDNSDDCYRIDTVKHRADNYTKQQLQEAKRARHLENIIMRPGTCKFADICLPHMLDCPVTAADVRASNGIFGKISVPSRAKLSVAQIHTSRPQYIQFPHGFWLSTGT